MTRLLAFLGFLLWVGVAAAQPVQCPTRAPGDSTNACASTAFVTTALPTLPLSVPNGGTGAGTWTLNGPLLGNGTSTLTQGTRSGNTTTFATTTGTLTNGNCATFDANGNVVATAFTCTNLLTANNTWSGTQTYSGNLALNANNYFGGYPYWDVKASNNGCAAAVGNGVTDDTTAIQCKMTYLNTNFGGGTLYFPPGNYLVSTVLTVKGQTTILGAGNQLTVIKTATDIGVISFDSTTNYSAMRDIQVLGYLNSAATANTVAVASNKIVFLDRNVILGGCNALYTAGIDGTYSNNYIAAYGTGGTCGHVTSNGANWYIRNKFDNPSGSTINHAFQQGTYTLGAGFAENHFTQCDFSGLLTNSVVINDGGTNSAITVFEGGVFSSPIGLPAASITTFVGAEFGSTSLSGTTGSLIVTASASLSGAMTIASPASRTCAANLAITC